MALLFGTATSFIVGFKNAQTYNRMLEAQQVWTAIAGTSRYWGLISRDFPTTQTTSKALIYRDLAWLTVLRYYLRGSRVWETVRAADGLFVIDGERISGKYNVRNPDKLAGIALRDLAV